MNLLPKYKVGSRLIKSIPSNLKGLKTTIK